MKPSAKPAPPPQPITPDQLREARIALGWSAETLAARSKTTVHIVNEYERSGRVAAKRGQARGFDALAAIRTALEAAGVGLSSRTAAGRERDGQEAMTKIAVAQITPSQMKAARMLLGWSRERLAMFAETTENFVIKYETQGRVVSMFSRDQTFDGLAAIRATLEAADVEFTSGGEPGVKLRTIKFPQ